jgi:hypothetical protein
MAAQRLVLALALALALTPRLAHAQAPSSFEEREALARFNEGKELFRQKKYEAALAKFKQSCSVSTRNEACPRILGLTHFELGNYAEATTQLRIYLAQANLPNDPALAQVRATFDKAYERSGHLDVSAPAGAQILVDEVAVGVAPLPEVVDVPAGRHTVAAVGKSGRLSAEVDAGAGVLTPVTLLASTTGASVESRAGAQGAGAGSQPREASEAGASGTSAEANDAQGAQPVRGVSARTVTVAALGATALAGLSVGVGFWLASNGTRDEARTLGGASDCRDSTSAACARRDELATSGERQRGVSITGFVVGGAAALGALGAALFWKPAAESREARTSAGAPSVSPAISPNFAGVAVTGRF